MASTFNPYGFKPIGNFVGGTPVRDNWAILPNALSAAYASNIFDGQPVLLNNGVLNPLTSTSVDFLGIFAGVQYVQTAGGVPIWLNWWAASTSFVTGTLQAFVTRDPSVLFRVQADGPVSSTAIGDQANISNATSGSTATGFSACSLSASLAGSGTQGQFRIEGLWPSPTNAWYDIDPTAGAYPELVVSIARSQYVSNKVAI